ncbi:hypothetical protein V1L54_13280 [Streptomyces sp. TRM 70361]|uniref:hypothetical protein n=1 Tax=Streptomyces sp. TRM 70361 TaxID=3116553 RepID=UPI002E7B22B2|nr:hypothetical protein [Streptomyces sp. TRM 70361]MEE1940364.1 hypothetical protein [Streptomyces sp. TRM 70361]
MSRLPALFTVPPPSALAKRLGTYLAGRVVFTAGATLFIHLDLGTDPLDVLALGIKEHVAVTIGVAQAAIAAVCIAVWSLWNRHRPVAAPFAAFSLCAYDSALVIMSGIGMRATDLIATSMTRHWKWPFRVSKPASKPCCSVPASSSGAPPASARRASSSSSTG